MTQHATLPSPIGDLSLTVYGERTVQIDLHHDFEFAGDAYSFLRISLHRRQDGRWQAHNTLLRRPDGEYVEEAKERAPLVSLVRDAFSYWAAENYATAASKLLGEKERRLALLVEEDERQLAKHREELQAVRLQLSELELAPASGEALSDLVSAALG